MILGHLSDTDICPTTEISFLDKRPCRTRIRKRTFVRKSVSIIFKIMLETMVYNVMGNKLQYCLVHPGLSRDPT